MTVYKTYNTQLDLISQYNTGAYSMNNCGIASLFMCLDYMDYECSSVESLRNTIKPYNGWIYTDEIEGYLDDNNIPYDVKYIVDKNDIVRELKDGIVMLCLDMRRIYSDDNYGVSGHFVVVVGYEFENGKYELEVFNPLNSKSVFYGLDEVYDSASYWWSYMFTFKRSEKEVVRNG